MPCMISATAGAARECCAWVLGSCRVGCVRRLRLVTPSSGMSVPPHRRTTGPRQRNMAALRITRCGTRGGLSITADVCLAGHLCSAQRRRRRTCGGRGCRDTCSSRDEMMHARRDLNDARHGLTRTRAALHSARLHAPLSRPADRHPDSSLHLDQESSMPAGCEVATSTRHHHPRNSYLRYRQP